MAEKYGTKIILIQIGQELYTLKHFRSIYNTKQLAEILNDKRYEVRLLLEKESN